MLVGDLTPEIKPLITTAYAFRLSQEKLQACKILQVAQPTWEGFAATDFWEVSHKSETYVYSSYFPVFERVYCLIET